MIEYYCYEGSVEIPGYRAGRTGQRLSPDNTKWIADKILGLFRRSSSHFIRSFVHSYRLLVPLFRAGNKSPGRMCCHAGDTLHSGVQSQMELARAHFYWCLDHRRRGDCSLTVHSIVAAPQPQ